MEIGDNIGNCQELGCSGDLIIVGLVGSKSIEVECSNCGKISILEIKEVERNEM